MTRPALHALALVAVLGVVAATQPPSSSSDRGIYQRLGRDVIVPDCADIHCFRPLVAAVLEHLPGPSLVKWKAYAVVANAGAALAVGRLALLFGVSTTGSIAAMWLCGLGTGSLYSIYEPYTSDALMYLLAPIMALQLWRGRASRAGWLGAAGAFAKEFAAAPLWIFSAFALLSRRWSAARRTLVVTLLVMAVWLAKQTWLMTLKNYRYGSTASVNLLHGGYFATWLAEIGARSALTYLFTTFGAVYVLFAAGFLRAGRDGRLLAVSAIPAAAAFLYVEQPERALWNFHFIVVPVATLALQSLPSWATLLFVAASGIVGLRFGGQFPIAWMARVALGVALVTAAAALVQTLRLRARSEPTAPDASWSAPFGALRFVSIAGATAIAIALLGATLVDVHAHRRDETVLGINQWGFRGPLRATATRGGRIVVVGGSAAFSPGTPWWETVPAQLAWAVNERRWSRHVGNRFVPTWVDNLAEPGAGADAYATTLAHYAYLRPDVICILDGYDAPWDAAAAHGRLTSTMFRTIGYLPVMPAMLLRKPGPLSDADAGLVPALRDGPTGVADPSCYAASAPYCAAMMRAVHAALGHARVAVLATPPFASARHELQQRSLAARLAHEFAGEPRFRYVDLGAVVDMRDTEQSPDGLHTTPAANRTLARVLARDIDELLAKP